MGTGPIYESALDTASLDFDDLTDRMSFVQSPSAADWGGFSDVFQATYKGKMVAVKVFREYHSNGNESTLLRKRKQDTVITREMHLWSTLRHYNVLPFLGYCFYPPDSDAPIFSLVSPWMRNGTLTLFLKANPKADRIKLLIDTVSGLSFLHSRGIVHGDLKPNNILVSDERIAVLADFGLAGSVEGEPSALGAASASISTEVKGTYRWLAPELACSMEGCRATIKSDMWAVGCILLDVITGIRPYDECGTVPAIICAMLKRLPPLEGGICAYPIRLARHIDVWSLCIGCWDYSPSVRPGCDTILWTLQRQRPYVHTACSADAAETNPGSVNPLKTMPLPSPLFTGRESIINQMTRYFSEDVEQQHIAVLHGLRGAGKSQIAYQFVYESQTNPGGSRFSEVFYVDARTASTLEHDMLSIARAKCHAEATMQDALRWLSDDKNDWLIVFDDADENFLLLNHLLLQCTHGNILITTCASALRAPIANYQVTEMELEEAKELLIRSMYPASRRLNHTTQDQIMSLVKVLRFALCIVHAGTHIANANIRIDEYLRLYAKTHSQLLEEWEGPAYKALTYSEYERIVYTTWFITLPQLSQKAKNFLRLGVCSPSGFTFESTTPADFRPSFAQSRSYCLVYYDPLNNRYSLTQPVTKWISDQLFPRNELTWRVVNPLQSVGPTWERTKQGSGAQDSLLRSVYNALGGISWGAGSNAPGALRQRVMGFPDDSFRLDHPDTLTSICQLVAICIRQKCFKVAEQLVHSLVEGFTKTVGSDDLQTLTSTSTLASIYSMQGRFREAKSLYGRVFQTRRRILGKGHDSTLTSLSDLRWTCSMLGDFRRAERWHRYGPDTRTERLGKEDPKTLDAMCHLATTLQREGKATEALAWERQLLEFEKKVEAV